MASGNHAAPAFQTVLYETKGPICHITLNRPEKLNAASDQLVEDVNDALFEFDADPGLQVAILAGAGRAFCSGADVQQRQLRSPEEMRRLGGPAGRRSRENGLADTVNWKPVIAAVHGYALGLGYSLSQSCDLVVAAEGTQFQIREVQRGLGGGSALGGDVVLDGQPIRQRGRAHRPDVHSRGGPAARHGQPRRAARGDAAGGGDPRPPDHREPAARGARERARHALVRQRDAAAVAPLHPGRAACTSPRTSASRRRHSSRSASPRSRGGDRDGLRVRDLREAGPHRHRHGQSPGADERAPSAGQLRAATAIWNDFEADPELWVGILTGAGDKAFSAGNDLRFTAEHGRDMVRMAESGFGGLASRTRCWKPILAAVNGYALGGGFEMALACDIIIAADHARLGLPEPRVGLMAGAGGVHRLPRMIPQKIAMGYILTGRHMTAQEAHRLGVVNEVVPLAELMPTAMKWANEILECAPLSIRASKQAALMGLGHPLDIALKLSYTEAERMRRIRGHRRGPARLRREAQAELEGALTC